MYTILELNMPHIQFLTKYDRNVKQVFDMGKNLTDKQICKFVQEIIIGKDHGYYVGELIETETDFYPNGVGIFVTNKNSILIGNFDSHGVRFGTPYLKIEKDLKSFGVYLKDRSRPDGAIFDIGVQYNLDETVNMGIFEYGQLKLATEIQHYDGKDILMKMGKSDFTTEDPFTGFTLNQYGNSCYGQHNQQRLLNGLGMWCY